MSRITVYVPCDTTAVALGADRVAQKLAEACRDAPVDIVRNGSRGVFWLEPLLEVEAGAQRIAYGPVHRTISRACWTRGCSAAIPPLRAMPRPGGRDPVPEEAAAPDLRPAGRGRPAVAANLSRARWLRRDWSGRSACPRSRSSTKSRESGLRGRGGAAFPAGIKWQTVLDAPGEQKYIVCNADEGDSGTFADRMLMEGDPIS